MIYVFLGRSKTRVFTFDIYRYSLSFVLIKNQQQIELEGKSWKVEKRDSFDVLTNISDKYNVLIFCE